MTRLRLPFEYRKVKYFSFWVGDKRSRVCTVRAEDEATARDRAEDVERKRRASRGEPYNQPFRLELFRVKLILTKAGTIREGGSYERG